MSDRNRTRQDLWFFIFLFVACVGGSVAIFLFAVGIETGHPIVRNLMEGLLEHTALILVLFVVFNILIFALYRQRSKIQQGKV